MKKKKVVVLMLALVLVVLAVFLVDRGVKNTVSEEIRKLVETHIKKEYKIDCKIKSASFSHYDEGITGGLYMYDFTCVNEDFKEIKISYKTYSDLSVETLDYLKVEKE